MFNIPPAMLIANVFVLVIAFTVHEFSHAWTADFFGDDTPRRYNRLTLNPLAHLDPMGSLMLIVAGFGWAKPTPIDPSALRRHSRSAPMWVSFAGPLSNLALAVLASIPFRLGLLSPGFPEGMLPTVDQVFTQFVFINLILTFFNLIPIPPLDGDKIAEFFFPPAWLNVLDKIRPYGPVVLLVLIFVLPIIKIDLLYWIIYLPALNLTRLLIV